MTLRLSCIFALALSFTVAACSDDDTNPPEGDTSPVADQSVDQAEVYPDLGLPPDIGEKEPCEAEWVDAIGPQDNVSTGSVTTTEADGVFTTKVDASAGGMGASAQNPYVYVSFADGAKVEITDTEGRDALTWDLALKRATLRVNGGDSGAGQGSIARLPGQTLDAVTAPPANSSFITDDFLDENCVIQRDPISGIQTAFNGGTIETLWYDYDMGGGGQAVTPKEIVYVLTRADGSMIKLKIDTYYSGSTSAQYTIRWTTL